MRRALGKGLSQLLGEQATAPPTSVPVEAIRPNSRQPRRAFDEESLAELAGSVREFGVIQPLVVRPLSEGEYELIAGERRLRAAKLAGLDEVPVTIRPAGAQASLEIAIIENVQREDISPMDRARAYKRLIEEFGLVQEDVAERVGKSRASVANTVRLLRLPEPVQEALETGAISEGHARAIMMAEGEAAQAALFRRIVKEGLSVRQAEALARRAAKAPEPEAKRPTPHPSGGDPQWQALADGLSVYFGSPVKLQKGEVGGHIVVDFYSDDDLQRILDVLGMHL